MRRIEPLANDFITVYESDIEHNEYAYTPGICVTPSGRIIATLDHTFKGVPEIEMREKRGMIFLSDDGKLDALARADAAAIQNYINSR